MARTKESSMKVTLQTVMNAQREAEDARRETDDVVGVCWMQQEQLYLAREREERLKADVESAEAEVARNKIAMVAAEAEIARNRIAMVGGQGGDGVAVDTVAFAGVGTKELPFVMEDEDGMEDEVGTKEFPYELE